MTTEDLMGYNHMVEKAMRSVVRDALEIASKKGLPGEHHFYITFQTNHPEVDIPDFLRQKYPENMTIVLQHQFFNLVVDEKGFSVQLSFSKQMCDLKIPFDALQTFADPTVNFGVQFNSQDLFEDDDMLEDELIDLDMALSIENSDQDQEEAPKKQTKKSTKSKAKTSAKTSDGGNVISLDAFRKKDD